VHLLLGNAPIAQSLDGHLSQRGLGVELSLRKRGGSGISQHRREPLLVDVELRPVTPVLHLERCRHLVDLLHAGTLPAITRIGGQHLGTPVARILGGQSTVLSPTLYWHTPRFTRVMQVLIVLSLELLLRRNCHPTIPSFSISRMSPVMIANSFSSS